MLNIIDLEKRWVRYKIKSYIPLFSILISLIIITSIFLTFLNTTQAPSQKSKSAQDIPIVVTKPIIQSKPIAKIKTSQVNVASTNKVILAPSLDFMRKMQNSIQPYYKNEPNNNQNIQEVQAPVVEIVTQPRVVTPKHIEEVKAKKIHIRRQNTQNDIYEIIARFKQNNNPALSLFIAKKYYELKDYQQAYNYALITNKINQNLESSWLIFTKALVKLGKRDKAISTLKSYIKQSHSSNARILLDEIYSGKFK